MRRTTLALAAALLAGVPFPLAAGHAAGAPDPAAMLADLKAKVLSKGPNGEAAASADSVSLTPEEVATVKAMHATGAISLRYTSTEWARAQIKGITDQLAAYGIPVIAVTDAGFKAENQVPRIETLLAREPSIIISIPVDPDATADVFRQAAAQGVKLVFVDDVPKGFVPGKDYVSDVSANNDGNGVVSGLLMAQALGGEGTVGLIYHLGADIAIDMAQNGYTKGTGSQWPIAQAHTEAKLAAYGLLGKPAPAYVALPAVPVTKANILDAWTQVHGTDAPEVVRQAAK